MRRRPRRAQASDAARPLGPKAAVLHARRQRLGSAKAAAVVEATDRHRSDQLALTSNDGALAFVLKASAAGLYVERTQRRPLHAHIVQSIVFESIDSFLRWCEADPVRFDHPVLYSRLRRHGDEILRAKR